MREPFFKPRHLFGATKPVREGNGVAERFLGVAVEGGGAAWRAGIVHLVVGSLGKLLKRTQMCFVCHGFKSDVSAVMASKLCWTANQAAFAQRAADALSAYSVLRIEPV